MGLNGLVVHDGKVVKQTQWKLRNYGENINVGSDTFFKSRFIDTLPWLDREGLVYENL
jgi:hypothetical protein